MKKNLTLLAVMLIGFNLHAQQPGTHDEGFSFDAAAPINHKALIQKLQMRYDKEIGIGWMIPSWNLLDYYWLNSVDVTHYANVIFPDSTVVYESGGTVQHIWLNSVGGTFEPYSEIFNEFGTLLINPTDSYRIDTLFLMGWYNVVNSGITDTLIVELVNGAPHTAPEFAWTVYNFPDDTINVSPAKVMGSSEQYGYQCRMTAPSKTVIKYPLTMNDSTMGLGKYILIPVNYNVPAGNITGVSFTFVPGQTYSFGDMLHSYSGTHTPVINSFRAGLYGTDNTTTDPHIFADPYEHWNSHHYIRRQVRYSMYTGSDAWRNERMVSSVTWGFDIGYYVTNTAPGAGFHEYDAGDIMVSPNPSSGLISVDGIPENTRVVVRDMVGNTVYDLHTSYKCEIIDLTTLNNGIYFIELNNPDFRTVRKVILQR